MKKIKQRIIIRLLTKLGKTNKEIGEQLRLVYGDNALQATTVNKCTNCFRNECNSLEDDAREGRPKTTHNAANIDRIRSFIEEDRRLTMRDIAKGTNINHETVRKMLHKDLGMRKSVRKNGSQNSYCRTKSASRSIV